MNVWFIISLVSNAIFFLSLVAALILCVVSLVLMHRMEKQWNVVWDKYVASLQKDIRELRQLTEVK